MARIHRNRYMKGERIKVIDGPYNPSGVKTTLVLGTVEQDSVQGLTCFVRLDRALSEGPNMIPKQHIEINRAYILHLNVINPRHETVINENEFSDSSDESEDILSD